VKGKPEPDVAMGKSRPTLIVGIGGSAGGLAAYKELLDALPAKTGMAFVIIAHLYPTAHSQLAEILSRHTKMPVTVAANAMLIGANHVYVIPPDADLLVEGNALYAFKVISPRTKRNAQIDLFLISLAEVMGAQAVGIVLSGYDGDGTEGCRHIKAKGGTTFAQDMSAEVNFMPLSAQASGYVDFVLPPDKISAELQRLAQLQDR
jgi:two-component system CheB/CheR fusion protein